MGNSSKIDQLYNDILSGQAKKKIKKEIPLPPEKKIPLEEIKTPTKFQSRVYQRMAEEKKVEGDLTYDKLSLKKDAEKAIEIIETDKQKAYQIAMGEESSPDVTQTSMNIALVEKALDEGNDSLATRLIKNRSLAQIRRGQEIVAEKGSITDNSVSNYVRELISTRLDKLGSRYLSDMREVPFKKPTPKKKAMETINKKIVEGEKTLNDKMLDLAEAQMIIDKLVCK
jgi:hypothetical protein